MSSSQISYSELLTLFQSEIKHNNKQIEALQERNRELTSFISSFNIDTEELKPILKHRMAQTLRKHGRCSLNTLLETMRKLGYLNQFQSYSDKQLKKQIQEIVNNQSLFSKTGNYISLAEDNKVARCAILGKKPVEEIIVDILADGKSHSIAEIRNQVAISIGSEANRQLYRKVYRILQSKRFRKTGLGKFRLNIEELSWNG